MTIHPKTEPTLSPKPFAIGVVTRTKILHLSCVIAVGLVLFLGIARADILVTNPLTGKVELWSDNGTIINPNFINLPGGATEGLQCVKLSSNEIYVANFATNEIGVFYLSGPNAGQPVPGGAFTITAASQGMASLAMNVAGTVLYAANYTHTAGSPGAIYAVDLPAGTGHCTPSAPCSVSTLADHDVVIGPDGNVYGTDFQNDSGVIQFSPLSASAPSWTPTTVQFIPPGAGGGGHFLNHAGGMVFDGSGDLWVTNVDYPYFNTDGIFEFTGPQFFPPGRILNFTPDTGAFPLGMDVSPINPPGPLADPCKGCIVVAQLNTKAISQINPTSCTGNVQTPGICTLQPFFTLTSGEPKYVRFTENCCDTGYVEICKFSCLTNPVTGYFAFTATNEGDSVGPLSIPVNACSGPVLIPNGTVTIKETQRIGVEATNITAYNYDDLGNQINALFSSNLAFNTGNVSVLPGDVSTETIAEFTNCASGPGELKICKIAGPGVMVGTDFSFTAKGSGPPTMYTVPAGPAPGGYCVVGNSYAVGTPVLVTERPLSGTYVSNVSVEPPDRMGTQTSNSVIAVIGSGTTEVTFTNTETPTCSTSNLLTNGSFETGDFTGWATGGNFTNTMVETGPFYRYSGAAPGGGSYYAVLGAVGSDGILSQSFTTTAGVAYTFCFWLNAVGDNPSNFTATWNGSPVYSQSNPNTGDVWTLYAFRETGTGSDVITFSFQDDPAYIALDNVSVGP